MTDEPQADPRPVPTPLRRGDVDVDAEQRPATFDEHHPAYAAIFEATRFTGGSAQAALARVRDSWDEAVDGSLPDARTVQRAAKRDNWQLRLWQEIAAAPGRFDATMAIAAKANVPLAIEAQRRLLLGGEGIDPKLANAVRGVARDVLFIAGAGLMG